jgi:protein O-GlcNAc transferase
MPTLQEAVRHAYAACERGAANEAEQWCRAILAAQPDCYDALFLLGIVLGQAGRFPDAVAFLTRAAEVDAGNADAHYNLGVALGALHRHAEALASYDRAIALRSDYAEAHGNRGLALQALARNDEALTSFLRAVEVNPRDAAAQCRLGAALRMQRRPADALACFEHAIALDAGMGEAHTGRGNALHDLGRLEEALASYERAVALDARDASALTNRGVLLAELGFPDQALASHDAALALQPAHIGAHVNRGVALYRLHRYADALAEFDGVRRLDQGNVDAPYFSAVVLLASGRPVEALAACDESLALRPAQADAWTIRGGILLELGRHADAVASFERALRIRPDHAGAHAGRGAALEDLGRHHDALTSYAEALRCDPGLDYLYGTWLHARMKICDWSGIEPCFAELSARILRGEKASPPMPVQAIPASAQVQRVAAETWARDHYGDGAPRPASAARPGGAKIRLGYFSADFREHAVSYLLVDLFEQHDRTRFEVLGFSLGPEGEGPMRARVAASFDRFLDVRAQSDEAIARTAREAGVDIAIDLGGYTKGGRPGVFAAGAAPVQVGYVGYLGTMGTCFHDYLIADATLIPEGREGEYGEKIAWLPSYQIGDSHRVIATDSPIREAFALPASAFVFACFNNSYKITPDVFAVWMRILHRVEDSVLFLYRENPWCADNLRREASARGIDPARLVFGDRLSHAAYLARFRACDLFLDTSPYNAGATANDALWSGLPLLTMAGETFAGRMAASLLRAAGLPELVAASAGDYEELAVELANDAARLRSLRERLAQAKRTPAPLFDTRRFARSLEAAYAAMHARARAGQAPAHIRIPA